MPLSIGVNLRVTGHCNQGGRKYMEDMFCVAFQPTPDDKDLEYAFFGIFDGHGGGEAATFAKEHLMDSIVKQKNFWSDRDEDVLRAIRDGYMNTHYAMWRELGMERGKEREREDCFASRSRARRSFEFFFPLLFSFLPRPGTRRSTRVQIPPRRRFRDRDESLLSSRVFPPPLSRLGLIRLGV